MQEPLTRAVNELAAPSLTPSAGASLDSRLQRAEAEVCRLNRCLAVKDRQLDELRQALAHSATIHYSIEDRLQRELDAVRIAMPVEGLHERWDPCVGEGAEGGVAIKLPYVTSILSVLFDAMWTFWVDCDERHLPKSTTVAHAIDARLGLSSQRNGEASRSAQAYASAIRPDWVKEADNRHHRRCAGVR